MDRIKQLAQLGHGAIEVDEAPVGSPPLLVVIAGPIKHWWQGDNFGSDEHDAYVKWRDAVEYAVVKAGHLVYRPYAALRGSWHETGQWVNNDAIRRCDVLVNVTPVGIPAEGTQAEVRLALAANKRVLVMTPAGDTEFRIKMIDCLVDELNAIREGKS